MQADMASKLCLLGCIKPSLNVQGVPKKSVNKEISITFKQRVTQRCARSQIGDIFGC